MGIWRIQDIKGIRQGCPLSASLFILAVEFLGMHIRQNECVEGIDVRLDSCLKSIKICQLADDTTIFAKNIQSAKEAEFIKLTQSIVIEIQP